MKRRVSNFAAAILLVLQIECAESSSVPAGINREAERGFEPLTYMFNRPPSSAAQSENWQRIAEWADSNFITTVDLYLSEEEVARRTPAAAQVVLRGVYMVDRLPFLGFQSTEQRGRWYWIKATSIVAVHFSLDPARLPDPVHGHRTSESRLTGMVRKEGLPTGSDPKEVHLSQLPLYDINDLIVDEGDLYFGGAAVINQKQLRVGRPSAHSSAGDCLFIRFYDAGDSKCPMAHQPEQSHRHPPAQSGSKWES